MSGVLQPHKLQGRGSSDSKTLPETLNTKARYHDSLGIEASWAQMVRKGHLTLEGLQVPIL